MIRLLLKFVISAAVVVAVSEVAKRNTLLGGFLGSLPLVSILALSWLYEDTHDLVQVAALSTSILWLVIPSLVLFLTLPLLLRKGVSFYLALATSTVAMLVVSGVFIFAIEKFGFRK